MVPMKQELIYGRQPVREMLRAGRRTVASLSLMQTRKPTPDLKEIEGLARQAGIPVDFVPREKLDQAIGDRNHQGVSANVSSCPTVDFNDLLSRAKEKGASAFILILDHIQDPQNLGSILRTAEGIGVHGVVLPSDRAAAVTPSAVRASAGAAEWMPVSVVPNLVRCMKILQQENFWLTGLEALPEAKGPGEIDFSGPVGLVIGSEGKGMSRLVRETCDFLLKLPMTGHVTSYNAGVAGAMAMYEVVRSRGEKG